MGYIYLRTNLINGKKYVGQAKDIKVRNRKWKNLNCRYGGCVINNARKKYGVDGFSFELLKECPNEDMNYWEMYYVKEYNSKIPNGYNMTDGGDSTYERTEETNAKVAAAKRGKPNPKAADALRGRKRPAEVGAKVAAALRGRKLSEEIKAKMSAAQRGKKLSEEIKARIGAAQKNDPKKSKAVQALDKNGNVVMEFPSAMEGKRHGFDASAVVKCCRGKWKFYKGFIWRYKFV